MHCVREPVPDLLRRFVATPLRGVAKDHTVQSNDLEVIKHFDRLGIAIPAGFHVRIVRDEVALSLPSGNFCTTTTCLVIAGATVVMVDRDQRSVFAFLAPDMPAEQFFTVVLPEAFRHHVTALPDVSRCDPESP